MGIIKYLYDVITPQPSKCPLCGEHHTKDEPHNPHSAKYITVFQSYEGRFPTWNDASAHMDDGDITWLNECIREVNGRCLN